MPTAISTYTQHLRTQNIHVQSKSIVITDAPTDNMGKGEYFSPTDLCCLSLSTCIITTIAIYCQKNELTIVNCVTNTTKIMQPEPRAIKRIEVDITLEIENCNDKIKTILERVAHTCPVSRSLHPNIEQAISFTWK